MATEHAAAERSAADAVRRAPPHIRKSINRARLARGLVSIAPEPPVVRDRGPVGVWWDPRSTRRPAGSCLRATRTGDRAILVIAHGDAPANAVRRDLPETISRRAFGTAEELNADRGWGVVGPGHGGSYMVFAGPSLRAVDTEVGIVLVWDLDARDRRHVEAAEMIERGLAPSVLMRVMQRRTLPGPIEMVTRARLLNVALVDRPAYGGAIARVFRDVAIDDTRQRREQLARVVRAAMFQEHRKHGRVV